MSKEKKIGKGFSKLSSSYIFLSKIFFGKALLRSQFYFPGKLQNNNTILICGIGTGELLVEILKKEIARKVVCVDISEGMIRKTKELLLKELPGNKIPVEFVCLPVQEYTTREKFDLIFFPYLLDCIRDEDIQTTLRNAKNQLNTNGKVILTDFQIPKGSSLVRLYAKFLLKILYFFFRIVCKIEVKKLPDFNFFFSEQGFEAQEEKTFYRGILFTRILIHKQN